MSEGLPLELKKRLELKKVIVFIGAGASLDILSNEGGKVFPSWDGLLESIASLAIDQGLKKGAALKGAIGAFETPMLLDMVRSIKAELPGETWRTFLRETFSIEKDEIQDKSLTNFKHISKINSPLTITTNYDPIFELAHANKLKSWTQKNSTEVNDLINGELSQEAIWHIHGHVDEVSSIILCSGDYDRLYQSEDSEKSFKHSHHLLERIAEKYSFLFVGFSLEDKFVVDLLKSVNEKNQGIVPPYYIICSKSEAKTKNEILSNLHVLPIENYGPSYTSLLKELASVNDKSKSITRQKIAPAIKNNLPEEEYADTGFICDDRINQCLAITSQLKESREFIFTIQGEGGVGKSAMARNIANLILEDKSSTFTNICWVSAKVEELTIDGTQKITGAIGTFEGMRKSLINNYVPKCEDYSTKTLIASIPHNSLIILDNLETISDPNLDCFLNQLPNNCKILITSRRALSKGLSYTPAPLTDKDAVKLATDYFNYLNKAGSDQFINSKIGDTVKKLHNNPLAIKWFIIGIYRGMEPNKLFDLHEKEVLNYCIKNIYDSLSIEGKSVLDVLRLTGERFSYSKLCFLTEYTYSKIEDLVLDELFKQSLINRYPDKDKYRVEIKPRVQSYLNYICPLDEKFIKKVNNRESRLKGRLDNFSTDFSNIPYNQSTLSGVNEDNLVAAIILKEVLDSLKKSKPDNNSEKLLHRVNEAKRNAPEYFECSRAEASVLDYFEQRHRAKQSFEIGLVNGGDNSSQYLFHFSKFLMKRGNENKHNYLSMLEAALKLDSKSQDIWLELSRALMFKGDHSKSRTEVRKILNSGIRLDQKILSRASDVIIQSYKREIESVDVSVFIELVQDQLSEYFLIPRSLRAKQSQFKIEGYFKEALRKITSFRTSFSSKKELDQISVLEASLKALIYPFNDSTVVYSVNGFTRDGDIEVELKNKKTVINKSSWTDTFPSSLLIVGEYIIEDKRGKFKRYSPFGVENEICLGQFPATVGYHNKNKAHSFAHLLNGDMIEVQSEIGRGKEKRELSAGEPIIITAKKANKATDYLYQKEKAFISVIKKDAESKSSPEAQLENSNLNSRLTGKIQRLNIEKGIGFILTGTQEYFLHSTKLIRVNLNELFVGDIVEFNPRPTHKSKELPSANNVVRIEKSVSNNDKKGTKKRRPKTLKKTNTQPIRKHGKVIKKNDSIIIIKSKEGMYTGLKADPSNRNNWNKCIIDNDVWFSLEPKGELANMKAKFITPK